MTLRRAVLIAACVVPIAAGTAAAQFQPPPSQAAPAGEPPPCVQEFIKLRTEAQKKAEAIQHASERKAPPQEACQLFNAFYAAEDKMMKYAVENSVWCGIPAQVADQLKKAHARTGDLRTKVCRAAAAPPRPAGPSLSDALTAPVPSAGNIKTGRGTYDTLTGTPLGGAR